MYMKIFLIAGHHNADPGAVNSTEKESDLTKELRGLIHDAIRELNPSVQIILDYDADTLPQVISKVNREIQDGDILIDVHFNSFSNGSATGAEVLVKNGSPNLVRAAVYSKIIANTIGIKDRGAKTEAQSHRSKLPILHGNGSRYLFEVCFMSNSVDMEKYHSRKLELAKNLASEILNG